MQKKVRLIVKREKYDVYGVTLPRDIGLMFKDVYVNISKSGNSIILSSGCKLEFTPQQVEEFKFEVVQ